MLKRILTLVLLVFFLGSCTKSKIEVNQNKFELGYGYVSDVNMKVIGKKVNNNYEFKQKVKNCSMYRIDVLKPKDMYGEVIVHNGNHWNIIHNNIRQTNKFKDFSEENVGIVIGVIYNEMINNKQNVWKKFSQNGIVYNVMYYKLGVNTYRDNMILYFNKDYYPIRMEIFNSSNVKKIEFIYKNFRFTKDFDEGSFDIGK